MGNLNNSREDWQKAIVERQHNLTPADITRTSQFRASGLSKFAPLPISIRRSYIYAGAALFTLGIAVRAVFDKPFLVVVGTGVGAVGLFVMVSGITWAARQRSD